MNHQIRDYFVRRVDESLIVTTRWAGMPDIVVCTQPIGPWIDIEDHRAWHVRENALPIAHGILMHHCALGRAIEEAQLAAAYWRGDFAHQVLAGCIGDHVHLTDVFINGWLVQQILDEIHASTDLLRRMRKASLSLN